MVEDVTVKNKMVKEIFLIRHGQTPANEARTHQNSEERLTAKGRLQVEQVAVYLKLQNIDTLLSSTYARAQETAEILSSHLGLPFTTSPCVVEVHRPGHLYGQSHRSLATIKYFLKLLVHRENENWGYEGAENMFSLRTRITEAKKTLIETEGKRIAVVTHDIFMNMFLHHVGREKRLTLRHFLWILLMTKRTPNTGIMHMRYDGGAREGVGAWQLIEIINPSIT